MSEASQLATADPDVPFGSLRALFPQFAEALALHARGDLEGARGLYLRLIERPRLTAACLQQLGVLATQRAEYELAAEIFRHSLKLDPSNLRTYSQLANTLSRVGRGAEGLAILLDQGCTLQSAGRYADAEQPYREILSHDRLNYGAYVNLGTCLAQMHRLPEATQQIFRAMQLYGRLDARVAIFEQELGQRIADRVGVPLNNTLPPGLPSGRIEKIEDAVTTLGKIMTEFCLPDEAILCHRQSIELAPGYALAHWNLSLALLATGRYAEAWAEYEWRWHWDGFPDAKRQRHFPPWRGESLANKRVLVWAEQGFGDTLQFAPLVTRLAEMGAQVTFEVMHPLVRLLAQSLHGIAVVDSSEKIQPLLHGNEFDFAVAHISLPAILGLRAESLPIAISSLRAEASAVTRWAQRIEPSGRCRAGIVWAGRSKPDARRSIPFQLLSPLFDRQTLKWYSLQVGPQAQDIPKVGNAAIDDLSNELTDFAETAAAMANLDLIVTIDTAAAHLAGALGKPTWLFLPWVSDWRWAATTTGASGSKYSAWYPSVRIFKQPGDGQWNEVIEAVGAELDRL